MYCTNEKVGKIPRVRSNGKMKYKKCNFSPVFAVVRPASVAVVTVATTIVFC